MNIENFIGRMHEEEMPTLLQAAAEATPEADFLAWLITYLHAHDLADEVAAQLESDA